MTIKAEQNFDAIYETHKSAVLGYFVKRTNSHEDAEDLTSEVFLTLHKHLPNYDESKSPLSAYIFVIARSRLMNYYRDKKITVSYDDAMGTNTSNGEEDFADQVVNVLETRSIVAGLLKHLSDRERDVIILRYFGNHSPKEISEKTGTSEGNVRVITTRSLSKMQKLYEARQHSRLTIH